MFAVYNVGAYFLAPLIFFWMLLRSRKQAGYRQRWGERIGFVKPLQGQQVIWLHAVSMGEVVAAIPLINRLLEDYPQHRVLVTTVTPTGSDKVLSHYGNRVEHCYLPYDFFFGVRRFLRRTSPVIGLIMETEIWPNLYHACGSRNMPLLLVSARLSERSERGYKKLPGPQVIKDSLRQLDAVLAQTKADAERIIALGADPTVTEVVGNIKFDLELDPNVLQAGADIRLDIGGPRPVWVAASTHDGEEVLVLEAHTKILEAYPNALLILVPRHPDRFSSVAAALAADKWAFARRSMGEQVAAQTQVYLADTMGELMALYAACDVAFVGGSFVTVGGHNVLEPAALGKPVLSGPQLFNFAEISDQMRSCGAMVIAHSADDLAREVCECIADNSKREVMGSAGAALVEHNRGALERLMHRIAPRIPPL